LAVGSRAPAPLYSHEIIKYMFGNSSPHADPHGAVCRLRGLRVPSDAMRYTPPSVHPFPLSLRLSTFNCPTMDSHPPLMRTPPHFVENSLLCFHALTHSTGHSPNVNSPIYIFLRTLLLFLALPQFSTALPSTTCALFREKRRGWGYPSFLHRAHWRGACCRSRRKPAGGVLQMGQRRLQ